MLMRILIFRDSNNRSQKNNRALQEKHPVFHGDGKTIVDFLICCSETEFTRQLEFAEGDVDGVILCLPGRPGLYPEIQNKLDRIMIPFVYYVGADQDIRTKTPMQTGERADCIQINPAGERKHDIAYRALLLKMKNRNNGSASKASNAFNTPAHVEVFHRRITSPVSDFEKIVREAQLNAVREVATGLAHELNNLITPIVGYAQLIMGKVNDDSISRKLEIIEDSAFRSSNLITDLLSFTGSTEMDLQIVESKRIFEKILDIAKKRTEKIEVSVKNRTGYRDGAVECDQEKLLDAVGRIIDNALLSVTLGGILFLEHRNERINEKTRQKYGLSVDRRRNSVFREATIPDGTDVSVFQVRDSGEGMDQKEVGQAVFPFYSGRTPQTSRGLGLAMAYGVIQSHGGVLSVRSTPGVGTCVSILLPIVSAGQPEPGHKSAERNGLKNIPSLTETYDDV